MKKYRYTIVVIALLLLMYSLPIHAQESIEGIETENADYNPLDELPIDSQLQEEVNIVLTRDWIITENQGLVTLSQQFSSYTPLQIEEMIGYPGYTQSITIDTNGYRIIIKEGGALTLQEFDTNSESLRIQGKYSESLFYVESGGTLNLNHVLVQNDEGKAVKVEAGGKYSWTGSNETYPEPSIEAPQGVIAIEPAYGMRIEPLKIYDNIEWRDELPTEHLSELSVICSVNGVIEGLPKKVKVVWNTEDKKQELLKRQDCILEGNLVDDNDTTMVGCYIPTLPVSFLLRNPIKILSADLIQNGSGTYDVEVHFEIPTDYESICLEVSEDSGENWTEIATIGNGIMLRGGMAYANVSDNQIRQYRMVVEGGPNAGISQTVQLPEAETLEPDEEEESDTDNSNGKEEVDGNRGGGTAVNPPDREPTAESQDTGSNIPPSPETNTECIGDEDEANIDMENEHAVSIESTEKEQETGIDSIGTESETAEAKQSPKEDSVSGEEISQTEQSEMLKQETEQLLKTESTEEKLVQKSSLSVGGQIVAAVLGVTACGMLTAVVCSPAFRSGIWRFIQRSK